MSDTKRFLNTSQAARHLDCAFRTLHSRIERGELTPDAIDAAGRLLFEAKKIEDMKERLHRGNVELAY